MTYTEAGKDSQPVNFNRHCSICSQPWLHISWTSVSLRSDLCIDYIMLSSHSCSSLYLSIPTLTFTPPKHLHR